MIQFLFWNIFEVCVAHKEMNLKYFYLFEFSRKMDKNLQTLSIISVLFLINNSNFISILFNYIQS